MITTEASTEDEEYTTCLKDLRQQRRRQGLDYGPKEYTATTEASAEEYDNEDNNNNNNNEGVSGGYATHTSDLRQQRRRQRIDDRPGGFATTTECQFSLLFCC